MKREKLKRAGFHFLVLFLLLFMILIFGPAEIFFANVTEFEFVYGEFAGFLAVVAIGVAFFGAVIMMVLPEWLNKLILSGTFGIALAGYLQVMFLNKQLDLLGLNPDGYQISKKVAIINLLIWLVIIAAVIFVAYYKTKIWEQILTYASAFLLAIQGVALVSLLLTAGEEAYRHPIGEWHLSSENQFVVSENENVIVLVLDWVSNQYIDPTIEQYPDLLEPLNDFTYYNNTDAIYFGTFPSLITTFSGVQVDPSLPINEWCEQAWSDETTESFYQMMRENGYVSNMYTPDAHHLCGTNNVAILKEEFSNLTDSSQDIDVFYKLLFKTITKMSCYRMMPEITKPLFYTDGSEYTDIIGYETDEILHSNHEFYQKLLQDGLTVDKESKYFIVQHLSGGHEYTTTADCTYVQKSTMEETVKGCMLMVEEYLSQLKELGVYDNSTIIITSDHGGEKDSQVIFFIKEAGESHDEMKVTNAPITLNELLPTVAKVVGADSTKYGQTIYDFSEDELRERSVWVRASDERYILVSNYALDRIGYSNIYKVYTYTGDYADLYYQIENKIFEVYQMADSFY